MERSHEVVPVCVTIPVSLFRALERARRRRIRTTGAVLPRSVLVREALQLFLENHANSGTAKETEATASAR